MAESPSAENYQTGGAHVYFAPWSGSTPPALPDDYVHVGNCPQFSTRVEFHKLVHAGSTGGAFAECESRIMEKRMRIRLTLDEINVDTVALLFNGVKEGDYTVKLLEAGPRLFSVKIVPADKQGPQCTIELWKVDIAGHGDIEWIHMNQYAKIVAEGTVLADRKHHPDNRFGVGTLPSA